MSRAIHRWKTCWACSKSSKTAADNLITVQHKNRNLEIKIATFLALLVWATRIHATEFFVATNGDNANPGTPIAPFHTIQRAAEVAQPGDVITVHEGIYRERINPPRGGTSDAKRITYQAAPGETVEIKGSEIVTNWTKVQGDVWKVTLPNSFFGNFNPYTNVIHGHWFNAKGRVHHTGAVYLNDDWLTEAAQLEEVLKPAGTNALWFGQADTTNNVIWAQFKGVNPNQRLVETNARQTVFYPERTGINYITVRGFTMEDAATPWAPPDAEQIGLIGPHWSKGWIIESNIIRYSTCSGISLGKYGDQGDTSPSTVEGFDLIIQRALTNGWNGATVGHHIVRGNVISHCEQAGIVGSFGEVFSIITGNTIHDIHVRDLFSGAEMAGIKFHGAVDVTISHNHIYRCGDLSGLWLDWMAQGTRVSGNLFHDNFQDLYVEVDHGPILFDNNLLLSPLALSDNSQGGAYVHNLFAGVIRTFRLDARQTPFLEAHSTALAGVHDNPHGDDRYYNNLFVQHANLSVYDRVELPLRMGSNVFLDGAKPSRYETNTIAEPDFDPAIKLMNKSDGFYLEIKEDPAWRAEQHHRLITTRVLGKAKISGERFENLDGSSLKIDTDYFGKQRNSHNPFPGPFETAADGKQEIKLWPLPVASSH